MALFAWVRVVAGLSSCVAISLMAISSADAQDAKDLFKQGFQQLKSGNPAQASELFERGLRAAPSPDANAYFYLGEAYRAQQKNDEARKAYQRAVDLDPGGQPGLQAKQRLSSLPGASFRDCDVCPEMVVVPPGSFAMGSPADEKDRLDDEGPARVVTISRPFAVGKFEVSFQEWSACVKGGGCKNGDGKRWDSDAHPVNQISWDSAVAYADWLGEKTGKRYRLLTEAEWEYVARAGTETSRYWGNSDGRACEFANVINKATKDKYDKKNNGILFDCDDGFIETSPPGKFKPNGFGLYDMLGNVWEWVQDCYSENGFREAPTDGSAHVWQQGCDKRVVRGGSWDDGPRFVRSASRYRGAPSTRYFILGFRVARTLSAP